MQHRNSCINTEQNEKTNEINKDISYRKFFLHQNTSTSCLPSSSLLPSRFVLSNDPRAPPPGSAAAETHGDRAGEEREAGDSPHANLHDCQLLSQALTLLSYTLLPSVFALASSLSCPPPPLLHSLPTWSHLSQLRNILLLLLLFFLLLLCILVLILAVAVTGVFFFTFSIHSPFFCYFHVFIFPFFFISSLLFPPPPYLGRKECSYAIFFTSRPVCAVRL